jgi:hypothetical protein
VIHHKYNNNKKCINYSNCTTILFLNIRIIRSNQQPVYKSSASFEESISIIVGFRVRKIFWKRVGTMESSDKVAEALPDGDDGEAISAVLVGVESVDDFVEDGSTTKKRKKLHVSEENVYWNRNVCLGISINMFMIQGILVPRDIKRELG